MEPDVENAKALCYCGGNASEDPMFTCNNCKNQFHALCLKSGNPSNLVGDIYFKFICENCSSDDAESFERMKLPWTTVLILSLYNLRLQGEGKCGYFQWRDHICRFIDENWAVFFGTTKEKSATWYGTVAGCLSKGANKNCFVSGVETLGENGWWSLPSSKLPTIEEVQSSGMNSKIHRKRKTEEMSLVVEGSRKKHANVFESTLSLKGKNDLNIYKSRQKNKKKISSKACLFPPNHKLKLIVPKIEPQDSDTAHSPRSIPKIIIRTERGMSPKLSDNSFNQWEPTSDDINPGISQDFPGMFDLSSSLDASDPFGSLLEDAFSEISFDKSSIKSSLKYESDEDNSNCFKSTNNSRKVQQHITVSRKKKAVTKEEFPVKETVTSEPKFTLVSLSEEQSLLSKLENFSNAMKQRPEIRRLYRKLVVRKLKRENSIPLFDLDVEVRLIRGMDPPEYYGKDDGKVGNTDKCSNLILDRYQLSSCNIRNKPHQYSSFITRLMGFEDEQHESIISPYTERVLKPFIFRDYKTKPLKLQLLEEIINRTNKSNPEFIPPSQSSIDYCYVRPQHIPAVNALCQDFFWPGIDLSESLQYPDFSCIALYRKVIIGFAFMVPDVKYNEAYITFIFCHPDWRRAGIATFMLYHLIQTCMGKDVTLHVSATSSAVFLYQKFGFKVEEFIHDFYDKYLPPESKECRHALFLRLSR